MKKIFMFILILSISAYLLSIPININQAEKIAKGFLKDHHKTSFKIYEIKNIENSKEKLGFIFQLLPTGFIAIPSDTDVYPVMAYSFTNNLIIDDENLIYYMLKTDIKNRMLYNTSEKIENNHILWEQIGNRDLRDFQQWPAQGSTSTGGWVEERWHQSSPYYDFCPLDDNGQRSVVGCVATAMAMIVDFHEYVGNVHFTNADDYWSGWYDFKIDDDHDERDFPSFPELNGYLDVLKNHYQNNIPLTNQDKAALSFACGISVEMSYSSEGSGAYTQDAASAFRNKFGFVSANYQNNYGTSFYNTLRNNMMAMKPAELTIHWADGSNGHAIICDGYNTDDNYHLNFGWGQSDNTCWYQLPDGMPSGYSVVDGAVVNIEGGDIPVPVTGHINIQGTTTEGIYITLDGPRFYEVYITDNSTNFEIPAVQTGTYTATAIKDGRLYYDSHTVEITQSNHYIVFNMGNYEALTGTVSAPISPNGTIVDIYKDNEIAYSGICDENGNFSIPNVLPGSYIATASLGEQYFDKKSFELTIDNQTVNFSLEEYAGNLFMGYHNLPTEKWSLSPNYTISCAIKLTGEEISAHPNDPVAKISFLAPISSSQGEISVQLWEDNTLLAEKEVPEFSENEWITQSLNRFVILNPEKEYYIAYKITSSTGELAYFDNGPRVEGKGAFFHTASWAMIPPSIFDKNFCIEADFISQDFAIISGTISTDDNYTQLQNGLICSSLYIAHSNQNGIYTLNLKEGTYDITALLPEHSSETHSDITVSNGDIIEGIDFNLQYQAFSPDNNIFPASLSVSAYPNPFVQTKNKAYVTFKLNTTDKKITKNSKIQIFNLKGEKIKTLYTEGKDIVMWNLHNKNNKSIKSGIYFYRILNKTESSKLKKLTYIK